MGGSSSKKKASDGEAASNGRSVAPVIPPRKSTGVKPTKGFLSHFKLECGADARLIQIEMKDTLGKEADVFLDSDDLTDLRSLLEHVKATEALILLQSNKVLTRPWVLLEAYTAIQNEVPIVAFNIKGRGYDYAATQQFLLHLDTMLDIENPGSTAMIKANGVDPLDMAYALSQALPNIISTDFNSNGSKHAIRASILEMLDTIAVATASPAFAPQQSKSEWLASRGSPSVPKAISSVEHGKGGEEESLDKMSALKPIKKKDNNVTHFTMAVGYSGEKDSTVAATDAFDLLKKKMSNKELHALVFVYSAKHDAATISGIFRKMAPADCAMIGMSSAGGCIVDGTWLANEGFFLAVQGIHDPGGVYASFDTSFPDQVPKFWDANGSHLARLREKGIEKFGQQQKSLESRVKTLVSRTVAEVFEDAKAKAQAKGIPEQPGFSIVFTSGAFPDAATEAVLDFSIGDSRFPLIGGGAWTTDDLPCTVSHSSGESMGHVQHELGIAGLLCWPSCHAAGAFCSGLKKNESTGGIITKCSGPNIIAEIDGKPAFDVYREWVGTDVFTDDDVAEALKAAKEGGALDGEITMGAGMPFFDKLAESGKPISQCGALGVALSGKYDGSELQKVAVPVSWDTETKCIATLVGVSEGQKVCLMEGAKAEVRDRTVHVAEQIVAGRGFEMNHIVGNFTFMCLLNWALTGDDGMQSLAEDLCETLGWVPMLAMIGGPEFGNMADGVGSAGSYMTSELVFSSKHVNEEMRGLKRQLTQLSPDGKHIFSRTKSIQRRDASNTEEC